MDSIVSESDRGETILLDYIDSFVDKLANTIGNG